MYFVFFSVKSKVFDGSISNTVKYFVFNTLPKSIFYNSGDGHRHVGIYASPDNWRTCLIFDRPLTFSPLSSHSMGSPDPELPGTTLFVTVFF